MRLSAQHRPCNQRSGDIAAMSRVAKLLRYGSMRPTQISERRITAGWPFQKRSLFGTSSKLMQLRQTKKGKQPSGCMIRLPGIHYLFPLPPIMDTAFLHRAAPDCRRSRHEIAAMTRLRTQCIDDIRSRRLPSRDNACQQAHNCRHGHAGRCKCPGRAECNGYGFGSNR
jgi:hypothetical protein